MEGSDLMAGGRERSQIEESDCRWRGAITGGGEQLGAISGGGQRLQVEKIGLRWRRAILDRGELSHGGWERSQLGGSDRDGWEQMQMKVNDQRGEERSQQICTWRRVIAGGGDRSQVEGRDLRWRGAISGGDDRS